MPISPADARAYLNRWTLVEQVERAELRNTSMATKLLQLASLMESRTLFGEDPHRLREEQEVRARWARLRQALGG